MQWRCVARQRQTRDAAGMAKHISKSEQLAVRIEPALRAALEAAAASDRRPVSQYVRNLILDAVDGDRERQVERASR
jgi:predicted HicB family RNase H-like nuclease